MPDDDTLHFVPGVRIAGRWYRLVPDDAAAPEAVAGDEFISGQEACALTGLTAPQLSKLCVEGGPVRFRRPSGRRLLVHAGDLARYLHEHGPPTAA